MGLLKTPYRPTLEMSELLDKQVNAQKEKTSGVHASSRKPMKKVCDENERNKRVRKNIIHRRKPFITPIQETGENDLYQLQAKDCGYNEGTICLVNGQISTEGMVFRAWAHEWCH